MKKEVPPFGVLAADYDPNFHVIVRSMTESKSERRPDGPLPTKGKNMTAATSCKSKNTAAD